MVFGGVGSIVKSRCGVRRIRLGKWLVVGIVEKFGFVYVGVIYFLLFRFYRGKGCWSLFIFGGFDGCFWRGIGIYYIVYW